MNQIDLIKPRHINSQQYYPARPVAYVTCGLSTSCDRQKESILLAVHIHMHVQTDENTNYGLYIGPNGGQKEAFFYLKLNKSFMKCITSFGLITALGISKIQREIKSQFDPVLDTQYILAVPSSLFGNARVKTRTPGQMLGAAPQSAGRANCCWRREIWFFGKNRQLTGEHQGWNNLVQGLAEGRAQHPARPLLL